MGAFVKIFRGSDIQSLLWDSYISQKFVSDGGEWLYLPFGTSGQSYRIGHLQKEQLTEIARTSFKRQRTAHLAFNCFVVMVFLWTFLLAVILFWFGGFDWLKANFDRPMLATISEIAGYFLIGSLIGALVFSLAVVVWGDAKDFKVAGSILGEPGQHLTREERRSLNSKLKAQYAAVWEPHRSRINLLTFATAISLIVVSGGSVAMAVLKEELIQARPYFFTGGIAHLGLTVLAIKYVPHLLRMRSARHSFSKSNVA